MAKDGGTIYFIAGLMMGGLIGAGMGMLMAPDDKKRQEMIKTGGEILDNSMKSIKKFQDEKIVPAIKDLSSKVKESVENFDAEKFEKNVMKTVENFQAKIEKKAQPKKTSKKVTVKKVITNR